MRARVLAGSSGWYVAEPDLVGGVTLYGPMLSVELAYEVMLECDERWKAMAQSAAGSIMAAYRRSRETDAALSDAFARAAEEWLR